MRMLAVLIGLGGTDFSRGLPYIGPSTLWNMLAESSVFSTLLQCYKLSDGLMHARSARDSMACSIYMKKFATHFKGASWCAGRGVGKRDEEKEKENDSDSDSESGCGRGFEEVLRVLRCSSLSDKTREDLPSPERVEVTFKNINWILQYWACTPPKEHDDVEEGVDACERWDYTVCYPDPVCGEYGFCRVSSTKKAADAKTRKSKGKRKGSVGGASAGASSIQWLDECSENSEEEGGREENDSDS